MDKLRMQVKNMSNNTQPIVGSTLHLPVESSSCHNGFSLDLDNRENKWSRHRSFLYGCDRSSGWHGSKLGS